MHRERLRGMKAMIDTTEPDSTQHKPSSAKKKEIQRTRQEEIDYVRCSKSPFSCSLALLPGCEKQAFVWHAWLLERHVDQAFRVLLKKASKGRIRLLHACTHLHPPFIHNQTQENHILLEKLINIKNFDSWSAFKPWLARSTFQYAPGKFYDPTTGGNLRVLLTNGISHVLVCDTYTHTYTHNHNHTHSHTHKAS